MRVNQFVLAMLAATVAMPALAGTANWGHWTSAGSGTVTGNIGSVNMTYSGGVAFSILNNSGTNFWTQPNPGLKPYVSATVSNAPSRTDLVALDYVGGTVTFSSPVTNPVMGIVSLGQPGHTTVWNFDKDFAILSQGQGYWGGTATSMSHTGFGQLTSNEGHGVIRFQGTFTTLSWTIDSGEYWAGFNFGVVIPLPSAAGLSTACLGVLALRRRRP